MLWLRLVHILAGVFWVGATVLLAAFLLPTARVLGPEGRRFLERLMRRGLGVALGVAALLTIVSGFIMYGQVSAGFNAAWMMTRHGRALGAGALVAILALLIGVAVNAPAGVQLAKLRQGLEAQGGAPSPAAAARIDALQARMDRGTVVAAVLLLVAAAAMATARYL